MLLHHGFSGLGQCSARFVPRLPSAACCAEESNLISCPYADKAGRQLHLGQVGSVSRTPFVTALFRTQPRHLQGSVGLKGQCAAALKGQPVSRRQPDGQQQQGGQA